jgi:hypothetical protein
VAIARIKRTGSPLSEALSAFREAWPHQPRPKSTIQLVPPAWAYDRGYSSLIAQEFELQ